jgi:ABC-type uncharacterized transport system auxiliary subunit
MTAKNASACLITLLLTGCGGRIRYPSYYTLEIPSPPAPAARDATARGTIAVRRFETPAYLRQGRIVYRETPHRVGFYEYHRWAADPAASATDAIIGSLRSARVFSFVKPYDGQDKPDYVMSGRLESLEEIDYGGGVRVKATLSAELINMRTGMTVWSDSATAVLSVDNRDINSVVAEMSHAIEKSVGQLVTSLSEQARLLAVESGPQPLHSGNDVPSR